VYLNTLSNVLYHTTSNSERLVNNELKITWKRDIRFSQLFCLLVYDAGRWKSSLPFFRVKKSKTLNTEAVRPDETSCTTNPTSRRRIPIFTLHERFIFHWLFWNVTVLDTMASFWISAHPWLLPTSFRPTLSRQLTPRFCELPEVGVSAC